LHQPAFEKMRSCTQFLIRDVEKGAQLLGIKLELCDM
jgi:hypothetical protein